MPRRGLFFLIQQLWGKIMGKVIILNEATGWTVFVRGADGATLEQSYVSGRNHSSPYDRAQEYSARHGFPIEHGGNSKDYDREMRAIARDPRFMC